MGKILIIIGGATATGKTKTTINLAEHFKTEIISSDSRQFYKELNIGVAKPSKTEMERIKHHFISHISIHQPYSVGEYEKDALKVLDKLFDKYDILFLCGGSGLYIDVVCEGLNTFPEIKKHIKQELNHDLLKKGLVSLVKELKNTDLETYNKIDVQNPRRVLRALEIYRSSGNTYSFYTRKKKQKRNFKTLYIALDQNRDILYANINKRVEKMIQNGLIDEAKKLYKYQNYQSLQTIGYQECFQHFKKNISLESTIEEIKKNTRRYAKRQINWFNKSKYHQFKATGINEINKFIQKSL